METHNSPFNESGFSLIEILISMLIFFIVSAGVSYALIASNQQMANAVHLLTAEQYGMIQSVSNGNSNNPVFNASFSGTQKSTSLPLTITLNPVQPTQACTPGLLNGIFQGFGDSLNRAWCSVSDSGGFLGSLLGHLFGRCQTTPVTPQVTAYTISVPVTAFTTSQSQLAWWNP